MLAPNTDFVREVWIKEKAGFCRDDRLEKYGPVIRRRWKIVGIFILIFAILGLGLAIVSPPAYTSTTSILIDRDSAQSIDRLSGGGLRETTATDDSMILNQMELIKSNAVAFTVIDTLKLLESPEFSLQDQSPFASIIARLTGQSVGFPRPTADQRRIAIAAQIADNLTVERIGQSYILNLSYTSPSPSLSVQISQAVANAYIDSTLNTRFDSIRLAGGWLQAQIAELRERASESDLAIQKFRSNHGLLSAGGRLLSDQQLSQLNAALMQASADTATASARYEQISALVQSRSMDGVVAEALGNQMIVELRLKYLRASKTEAEITARLGENHGQAVRLREDIDQYQRLMFDELARIAEAARNTLDVAKTREATLAENLKAATGAAAANGETQVQLRELERVAAAYRDRYQSLLARYQNAAQQRSFPIADARIVARGTADHAQNKSKTTLHVLIFGFLGGVVGMGVGSYRELRDRSFRTEEQVRDSLDLDFLGFVPLAPPSAAAKERNDERHDHAIFESGLSYAAMHPASAFSETLRSAKITIDLQSRHRDKVIGIVSGLPHEGKSTIAANLAQLLAMQGASTLLIDADFRSPGLTKRVRRSLSGGLADLLDRKKSFGEVVQEDPETGLLFLPATLGQHTRHTAEPLPACAMGKLLNIAKQNFDYVIVDLPPMAPLVDARAISPDIDTFIFVVEWGKTDRNMVATLLSQNPAIRAKCAGVILNRVETDKMKLYYAPDMAERFNSRYVDTSYNDGALGLSTRKLLPH